MQVTRFSMFNRMRMKRPGSAILDRRYKILGNPILDRRYKLLGSAILVRPPTSPDKSHLESLTASSSLCRGGNTKLSTTIIWSTCYVICSTYIPLCHCWKYRIRLSISTFEPKIRVIFLHHCNENNAYRGISAPIVLYCKLFYMKEC